MRKTISGFTIVEIMVIVVVIGVIAAIVVVSYSDSQNRTQNTSRVAEMKAWQKAFIQYKAANGSYPNVPQGGYCLGTGFPNQKCRDFNNAIGPNAYGEAGSVTLMNLLSTYDPPNVTKHVPVGATVGPYVEYNSTGVHITSVFNGGSADCPNGTYYNWSNGDGRVLCRISFTP